ncbi:MAG TPA: restriction endonuclease subunit S, partial [Bryobacteraceae bacterium]|nr:restriction endonuclease subunit S [Bryobacteraceae bacterium]
LNGGITPSGYTHKSNAAANTIAISEGGNSCGFVQFMKEPYWCGGHCYSVIPQAIDNRFLYHALKGQQSAIMALRVGSGLPNVQKTALLAFELQYPVNSTEQTAIAEVLTEMDAELAALEQRREKTRALKQAMMQELLTGKTRLLGTSETYNPI